MKRFSEPAIFQGRTVPAAAPGTGRPAAPPGSLPVPRIRREQLSLPDKLSEWAESRAGPDRVAAAVEWVDKELRKVRSQ